MVIHHVPRGFALLALLPLLVSLPACGGKSGQTSAPSALTSPAVSPVSTPSTVPSSHPAPQTARWTELKPGQCLAAPPPTDPAVVTVDVVDCATPHSAEVYLRVNIPVDTALTDTANAQCATGLAQYTGKPSTPRQYTITYMIDSDQDRTFNNPLPSTLICLLQSSQGQPLTGTAHA